MRDIGRGYYDDPIVFLAVTTAFAVPALLGCIIALGFAAFGHVNAAVTFAGLGLAAGLALALFVRSCA